MGRITNDFHAVSLADFASPQAITNSYVQMGSDITAADIFNQLVLELDLTLDTLTSAEVKIEFTNDGTDFFQETFQSVNDGTRTLALGENTMSATGKYLLTIPIVGKTIRVSVKGTGAAGTDTMGARAILAVVA